MVLSILWMVGRYKVLLLGLCQLKGFDISYTVTHPVAVTTLRVVDHHLPRQCLDYTYSVLFLSFIISGRPTQIDTLPSTDVNIFIRRSRLTPSFGLLPPPRLEVSLYPYQYILCHGISVLPTRWMFLRTS